MTEEKKSFAEKVLDIDHRILASVVMVITAVLLLFPVSIPFPISSYGKNYYNFVQEVPPETLVGFMCADGPNTRPSLESATVLMMNELYKKDCNLVIWSDNVLAIPVFMDYQEIAEELLFADTGKTIEYGVDWVYLGYIAGMETGAAALLADIRGTTANKDYWGNSLDDFPIMEGINTGFDFKYGFFNCGCAVTEPTYVRQWAQPYGTQAASINCAMDLAAIQPYLATGQLRATGNGLLGSAEMEYQTGKLGLAYGQTLAVSVNGLYYVLLIFIGNIFFFYNRMQKGGTQ